MTTPVTNRGRFASFYAKARTKIAALVAVCAIASMATAAQAPELKRKADNEARLVKMSPYMRPKVRAMIGDLESHGDRPVIHSGVYRTPAEQAKLKAQGFSKVSYSFHNVTDIDPKTRKRTVPAAFAGDLIDYYKGYKPDEGYWLRLASTAQAHGLTTGVYWGLSTTDRERIRQIIESKTWTMPYKRGWDPSHTEPLPSVLTLGQAQAGKRPPYPPPR